MRIADLVTPVEERNPPSNTLVFSVSERLGIVPQDQLFVKKIALDNKSAYLRIRWGDIVYNPYLLWNCAVGVCFDKRGGCVSPAYVVLRPREHGIERFLHYFFRSRVFTLAVDAIASGSVTRRRTNPLENILDLEFDVPSLPEMRAINLLLVTLDNKIELNQRMNETLEAMAQALFKSWFVNFEPFRDYRMESSILGEIPAGWHVLKLGQVLELAYGKGLKEDDRQPGDAPVYGSNGQVGWHNKSLVKGPGIIVGRKGNPGIVTWIHTDFFPIDTTFFVKLIGPIRSMVYVFHALRLLDLPSLSADSAVPGLNRNVAYLSDILVPPETINSEFDRLTVPLMQRVYTNEKESKTLSGLRDTLLPKLISGMIRLDPQKILGGELP